MEAASENGRPFVLSRPCRKQEVGQKEFALQTTISGSPAGFPALGLTPQSLEAVRQAGYSEPSPIQLQLIPPALAGRDCIGNAPTGSGKTAAFLLPMLEKIDERDRRVQAVVLAPTRELAHQIGREFHRLSFGRRCRAVAVVGGESMFRQMKVIASGCQVVIATPGRLIDLMTRDAVRLDAVRFVVLDEADQMLDIGFRPAVESILDEMASPRQTLLLSATLPPGVRELMRRYLNDPIDVRLIAEREDATVPAIRQSYLMVHPERKIDLLVKLLQREQPSRAIVFCRTKHGTDKLGRLLQRFEFNAEPMHGDLSQSQRNRVLHGFRAGRVKILVATDVVGRGIDVPEISHVLNFDLPEDPEHYVHRIGRTGRMGRDGAAFSFVLPDQGKLLDEIEKAISRELQADQVEGIPAPDRPVDHRRPQRRPPVRGKTRPYAQRRGPSPGGRRPRRFGSPQRVS
jgi:ATP-dependent RNA helicase DeaD